MVKWFFGSATLHSSLENQEEVFDKPFAILGEALKNHAFPGASVAVTHAGNLIALKSFGKFVYEENTEAANPDVEITTLFDLASLTKPIATTTMAMILYERGLLELDAPIFGTIPEFLTDDPRRREVTFRMLLGHSSGLPAYEKLFLNAQTRDELLQAAFTTALTAHPATRAEYSDIGFIVLGVALERIAEEALDVFCQREIWGAMGMIRTTFNPPKELRASIPPTADERVEDRPTGDSGAPAPHKFRNRIIQGEVQDENACVLGGVAGHAGLFSNAEDVAHFAQCMLGAGSPILRPETIALFTRREPRPAGTSRTLGWDTPTQPSQSGKHFGPRSYGHLGYTGTSLWIDPDRQLSITLLTNRTWPDCSNQAIKQVRPKFHDAVIEALEQSSNRDSSPPPSNV